MVPKNAIVYAIIFLFTFYNNRTFMGGVMFVSGGGISFSGFLFVSVETVCVFN
ncbi:putative membrane protein [Bacteroides fragilis str. 3988 T1]|nr:putative membrane protein [Bacteroides fragilis str. 3988 T1]EYA29909.1 putative membrane protein [Bacteroides fragilis str. 1009-4-F \